jgi:SAM-dependent methyltransferase
MECKILFVKTAYVVFYTLLFPIYYFNKRNMNKHTKTNPFYTSIMTKLLEKHPLAYELFVCVTNFPVREGVYKILPSLSGTVLQVGCGTGLLNLYCKKNFTKYGKVNFINMDVNKNALRFGKSIGRFTHYLHASIYDVPLENESIDYIIFARCLHHIKSHKKMFTECARILKKNGEIIILDVAVVKELQKTAAPLQGSFMVNSSLDGLIWRYDKIDFTERIKKTKTDNLEIVKIEEVRQINITNYNLKYPQTDILGVLKKVT